MKPEDRKSNPSLNSKIDRNQVVQFFANSKVNNRSLQCLTNIFNVCRMQNQPNQNPALNQAQISKYISSKMLPDPNPAPRKPIFNPATVYPINKAGSFGVLVRSCTIVDKGILQKDGQKPAVLKQIVNFISRVQNQKTNNKQKLEWLKDSKLYPFRIILIDKDKDIKALYCKDLKQAEAVRINFINKFRYKGNIGKLKMELKRKFASKISEMVAAKLQSYAKNKKLEQVNSRQKSGSLSQSPSRILDKSGRDQDMIQNILNKNDVSNSKSSNRGYDTNVMKLLIDKQQSRISSQSNVKNGFDNNTFYKLTQAYKRELFMAWKHKANDLLDNKQIEDEQQSIRNINSNSLKSKSKYSNGAANALMNKPVPQVIQNKQKMFTYKSIQFLKQHQIFVKPIVVVSLHRNNSVQSQTKFNTIIQKKDPHLSFQLVANNGDQTHKIKGNPAQYVLIVKAIDYLSNSQMCNQKIPFKSKVITFNNLITNNEKTIRIEIEYQDGSGSKPAGRLQDVPEGCYLQIQPISQKVIQQIRQYWEKQAVRRSYYNMSKDIKIIQIFQLYDQPPKSWALGLSESDYKIVYILNSASKILNFKLTQSILPIIRVLQRMYSEFNELIQVCLAIMANYMRPYYFVSQFNKLNKLHLMLGLEGQIQISSKVAFQIQLIKRITKIQSPELEDKLKRKNIAYPQLLYQYIYQIFSKNFGLKILVQIWNFLFRQPAMTPVYTILISCWLIKFYSEKLNKCRRFKQICEVLQSKQTCSSQTVIRQIIILRQKYFGANNSANLIQSIRGMFNVKPLEQVVIEFYKRETQKLDKKKQNRNTQKKLVLQKLCSQMKIQLPKYSNRSYCLHIYFYKLPAVGGSLYIKANNIQYECLNIPRNRYFIIGQVSTPVTIQLINNKSDEFTCKLQCMQGINKYCVQLKSLSSNEVYKIQYICGLLTEGHIDALKKNKKFEHFIGAFVQQQQLFDQFLRPITECNFLNSFAKRLQKQDLGKKIKVVFSSGSKNFDEVEFYLRWICESFITLPQKIKLIKQYAHSISQQYFLSDCKQLQRILISKFLNMIQFHLSPQQFECYYSDSIQDEFNAPKIIKCRLLLPNGTQIKLQHIATTYMANKANTHLHQDIQINDLINSIQKYVDTNLNNVTEASLNLIYSNYGDIRSIQIPVIKKKSSKDLIMNDIKFQFQNNDINDIITVEPEVLVTQILPTFSKISTILDFVSNSKTVQTLGKNKDNRKIAQPINLLKNCDAKYNKIILMRYSNHPTSIKIPFLKYYHELIYDSQQCHMPKNLFLNNLQTDIKTICTYRANLNFSDNKKIESTLLDKDFGLYGNLRILPPKTDFLYFVTMLSEQEEQHNGKLFVNYGYGVYRWEPCYVLGYYLTIKEKQTKLKQQKKTRKQYLVNNNNTEKLCRDFQIKIDEDVEKKLIQLDLKDSPVKAGSIRKPADITASRKQTQSNQNKSNSNSQRKFNV